MSESVRATLTVVGFGVAYMGGYRLAGAFGGFGLGWDGVVVAIASLWVLLGTLSYRCGQWPFRFFRTPTWLRAAAVRSSTSPTRSPKRY